jgi:tetratricopeptide (TPR) repeat protein
MPEAFAELGLGHPDRAAAAIEAGVALARAIGERRLAPFLQSYASVAAADLGSLDEALRLAHESVETADQLGFQIVRTEARRCLAYVHYVRGEWDAAIRRCDEVLQILDGLEPAICKLHMGPTHVKALVAAGRLDEARVQLAAFEQLTAQCQSQHAADRAADLRRELGAAV